MLSKIVQNVLIVFNLGKMKEEEVTDAIKTVRASKKANETTNIGSVRLRSRVER
jgi:hypothetical protein